MFLHPLDMSSSCHLSPPIEDGGSDDGLVQAQVSKVLACFCSSSCFSTLPWEQAWASLAEDETWGAKPDQGPGYVRELSPAKISQAFRANRPLNVDA